MTANLVNQRFSLSEGVVKFLPLNVQCVVSEVEVTLMEANQ